MQRIAGALLVLTLVAISFGAPAATAQHPQVRHGFWFNGGLGYGSLGCEDCDGRTGGLTGGISLGGVLSPNILFGVGTTGWTKDDSGFRSTVGTLDARFRFYPKAAGGFFLTAGIGLGDISVSGGGFSQSETGLGIVLGLGLDLRVADNLSLTPFWNGFAVRTSNGDANVGQLGLSLTVH